MVSDGESTTPNPGWAMSCARLNSPGRNRPVGWPRPFRNVECRKLKVDLKQPSIVEYLGVLCEWTR